MEDERYRSVSWREEQHTKYKLITVIILLVGVISAAAYLKINLV